jgi:hypothetical protein
MHTTAAPFSLREAVASILLDDPEYAFELAACAGAPKLPKNLTIRSVDGEFADPDDPSKIHRADLVLVAYGQVGGRDIPVQAVVFEILDRKDPQRVPSWQVFPEAVLRRYGCVGRVVLFPVGSEVCDWAEAHARTSPLH